MRCARVELENRDCRAPHVAHELMYLIIVLLAPGVEEPHGTQLCIFTVHIRMHMHAYTMAHVCWVRFKPL